MKWTNPSLLLTAALVTLAPVGVRLLTRSGPPTHSLDDQMVQEGEKLFMHEWTPNDPLTPSGDGLGPVFNATSCVACHHQGGVGGSGGVQHNVTTFTVRPELARGRPREGVIHARGVRTQETLAQVDPSLPAIAQPTLAQLVPMP